MNAFLTLVVVAVHTHVVVHAQDGTGNETLVAGFHSRVRRPEGKDDDFHSCAVDVDFGGNDIYNFRAADVHGCKDKCKYDTNCNAYTWTNYQGGTCWMKSSGYIVRVGMGAHSCGWELKSTVLESCDMPGNDLTSVTFDVKQRPCDFLCKHALSLWAPRMWASTRYQGRCYCKSKVTPCVHKPGASTIISFYHEDQW